MQLDVPRGVRARRVDLVADDLVLLKAPLGEHNRVAPQQTPRGHVAQLEARCERAQEPRRLRQADVINNLHAPKVVRVEDALAAVRRHLERPLGDRRCKGPC